MMLRLMVSLIGELNMDPTVINRIYRLFKHLFLVNISVVFKNALDHHLFDLQLRLL